MDKLVLLALNTFEESLRRRTLYILVFIALLAALQAAYQLVYMAMAEAAGELEMLANLRGQFVLGLFGIMKFFGVVLSVFLGSVALASEIHSRTIVPVLSRPVGRGTFFFAKWIGVFGFLGVFLAAGVVVGLALTLYWELQPTFLFGLGVADLFLQMAILSAVSLALSTRFHPVLAGGLALLLAYLRDLTEPLLMQRSPILAGVGVAGRYLSPARTPHDLLESGLVKGVLDPSYGLYFSVLAENAGYALAAVLVGALLFRNRELLAR